MCIFCICLFSEKTVGFNAKLKSSLSNYHQQSVIYDAIDTNQSSGYSATSGLFTASMEGTYVFIWNGVTNNSTTGYCELYLHRNGIDLQYRALADARGRSDGHVSASISAVLYLNAGDTVGIKTGNCNHLHGSPWTSFSGFKI